MTFLFGIRMTFRILFLYALSFAYYTFVTYLMFSIIIVDFDMSRWNPMSRLLLVFYALIAIYKDEFNLYSSRWR